MGLMHEAGRSTPQQERYGMSAMTAEEMDAFLRRSLVAVLTTIGPEGELHSTPVWFEYEDGRFYFWVGEDSVKARHIRHNRSIAACIATHEEPYQYVSVAGNAVMTKENVRSRASSICRRYYPDQAAQAFVEADLAPGDSLIVTLIPSTVVTEREA
jgi:PPOX class probable F420-dependent enzyme